MESLLQTHRDSDDYKIISDALRFQFQREQLHNEIFLNHCLSSSQSAESESAVQSRWKLTGRFKQTVHREAQASEN